MTGKPTQRVAAEKRPSVCNDAPAFLGRHIRVAQPPVGFVPGSSPRPVILVVSGALNPPHRSHVALIHSARSMIERGADGEAPRPVLSGVLIPSSESYVKGKLRDEAISLTRRTSMCRAAIEDDGAPYLGYASWGVASAAKCCERITQQLRAEHDAARRSAAASAAASAVASPTSAHGGCLMSGDASPSASQSQSISASAVGSPANGYHAALLDECQARRVRALARRAARKMDTGAAALEDSPAPDRMPVPVLTKVADPALSAGDAALALGDPAVIPSDCSAVDSVTARWGDVDVVAVYGSDFAVRCPGCLRKPVVIVGREDSEDTDAAAGALIGKARAEGWLHPAFRFFPRSTQRAAECLVPDLSSTFIRGHVAALLRGDESRDACQAALECFLYPTVAAMLLDDIFARRVGADSAA